MKGETAFPALSEEDRMILEQVIEALGSMTKNEIVSCMHEESAYIETLPRDMISFKYAEDLKI